jgi:hypothetical protein
MAYLYRHIRLDKNEVFYIGIGKDKMVESCKKTNELKRLSGIPRYKTVICNQCGKEGSANNMSRYHFQNCKQK